MLRKEQTRKGTEAAVKNQPAERKGLNCARHKKGNTSCSGFPYSMIFLHGLQGWMVFLTFF